MTFSKRIRALPREYLSPPRTLPSAFLPLIIHITFTERPKMSHSVYMTAPFSAQKHMTSSSCVLPLLSSGLKKRLQNQTWQRSLCRTLKNQHATYLCVGKSSWRLNTKKSTNLMSWPSPNPILSLICRPPRSSQILALHLTPPLPQTSTTFP
jgi:hypothetical protein